MNMNGFFRQERRTAVAFSVVYESVLIPLGKQEEALRKLLVFKESLVAISAQESLEQLRRAIKSVMEENLISKEQDSSTEGRCWGGIL